VRLRSLRDAIQRPATKFKRCHAAFALQGFHLTEAEWNDLMVPINMAFFFKSSLEGRVVAMYPSPAGATESLLALDSWNDIVARNSALNTMEPDVEGSAGEPPGIFARIFEGRSITCFRSTNVTNSWV
jgi:hypothetical protein